MSAFSAGPDLRLVRPKHRILRLVPFEERGSLIVCACGDRFLGATRFASLSAFYGHVLAADRQEDGKP